VRGQLVLGLLALVLERKGSRAIGIYELLLLMATASSRD
jgi:hypothetical protein